MSDATVPPPSLLDSAGRVGKRQGRVSELTRRSSPAAADRLHAKRTGDLGAQMPATNKRLGTVHDIRFVIFDNHARPLLATVHVGDWDPYIDDFVRVVPT